MADATDYYAQTWDSVLGQIATMSTRVETWTESAQGYIQALGAFSPDMSGFTAPAIIAPTVATPAGVTAVRPAALGEASIAQFLATVGQAPYVSLSAGKPTASLPSVAAFAVDVGTAPAVSVSVAKPVANLPTVAPMALPTASDGSELVVGVDDITVPEYTAAVTAISLPDAPEPIDVSGRPAMPDVGEVAVPDAPDIAGPDLPELAPIVLPVFDFSALPTFQGVRPQFTAAAPEAVLNWSSQDYASALLEQVKARVAAMLDGGTGLPPEIESALFERARARESSTALARVQDALDTWAGRGFSMPPGMLVANVNAAQQQSHLAANDLSRDILSKAAQWEIENLRSAVQGGVSLEQTLMQVFKDMRALALDAAKEQLLASLKLYDSFVAKFNADQQAYQADVAVFREEVAKALGIIRAEVDTAQLAGQLNEQRLRQYVAEWDGIGKRVEVFAQRMRGAELDASIKREKLARWGEEMGGWVKQIEGQQAAWAGYETAVRGQAALVSLEQASVQAFSERLRGTGLKTDIAVKKTESRLAALREATARFTALVGAERERLSGDVSVLGAQAKVYETDANLYATDAKTQIDQAGLGLEAFKATTGLKIEAAAESVKRDLGVQGNQVEVYKADAGMYGEQVRGESVLAGVNLDAYKAQTGFAIDVNTKAYERDVAVRELGIKNLVAEGGIYSTQVGAQVSSGELGVRASEAQGRNYLEAVRLAIEEWRNATQIAVSRLELVQKSAEAAGQLTAQVAGGGLAALHVATSISGHAGLSNSASASTSTSTSYNHDYDELTSPT